jgi:hypothetical protein
MNAEGRQLVEQYISWLKEKISCREIEDGWIEITTPNLDRHNDYLQIYVKKEDSDIILTDGGYILDDLALSGFITDTDRRKSLVKTILNGFGVKEEKGQLMIHASDSTFPIKKHNLIQAMLAVNDLFSASSPHVASLFFEDVAKWLETNGIRYISNRKLTGKSGFDHMFDFLIPKSKDCPERLLKVITSPTKESALNAVFAWSDTIESRGQEVKAIAVLNDTEKAVKNDVIEALSNYGIAPILWSERNENLGMLAA